MNVVKRLKLLSWPIVLVHGVLKIINGVASLIHLKFVNLKTTTQFVKKKLLKIVYTDSDQWGIENNN